MMHVISKSWSSSEQNTSGTNEQRENKMNKAQKNVLATCITLVVLYLICWLYYAGTGLCFTLGILSAMNDYYNTGYILIVLNSSINPFVYAARYKEFQQAFLACFKMNKKDTSATTSNYTENESM